MTSRSTISAMRAALGLTQHQAGRLADTTATSVSAAEAWDRGHGRHGAVSDAMRERIRGAMERECAARGVMVRLRPMGAAERQDFIDAHRWRLNRARDVWVDRLWAQMQDDAATTLRLLMAKRIVELYDEGKIEHGDAILEFLPTRQARALLDDYFPEDFSEV